MQLKDSKLKLKVKIEIVNEANSFEEVEEL